MGLFAEQIEERRDADRIALEESFQRIAGVVLGERMAERLRDEGIVTREAVDVILKSYHLKPVEIPEKIKSTDDQMDYCLRHYGLMRRDVELVEGWYRDAYGPLLGFRKDSGTPVALLPGKINGYYFRDTETGKTTKINKKTAALFDTDAICFYRPLPLKGAR